MTPSTLTRMIKQCKLGKIYPDRHQNDADPQHSGKGWRTSTTDTPYSSIVTDPHWVGSPKCLWSVSFCIWSRDNKRKALAIYLWIRTYMDQKPVLSVGSAFFADLNPYPYPFQPNVKLNYRVLFCQKFKYTVQKCWKLLPLWGWRERYTVSI